MGRSQESWSKREKEKKKKKKKEEKLKRKEQRQEENAGNTSFDDMIAWVDADGNPTDSPPAPEEKAEPVKAEDIVLGVPPKDESLDDDKEREGTVTFFNESKGYGFIKVKGSGESIFTHVKSHLDEIREGNRVQFDIAPGEKGPEAIKVKIIR